MTGSGTGPRTSHGPRWALQHSPGTHLARTTYEVLPGWPLGSGAAGAMLPGKRGQAHHPQVLTGNSQALSQLSAGRCYLQNPSSQLRLVGDKFPSLNNRKSCVLHLSTHMEQRNRKDRHSQHGSEEGRPSSAPRGGLAWGGGGWGRESELFTLHNNNTEFDTRA